MTCKIIFGKKDDGSIDKSIIQEVKAPNGKRSLLFDTIRDDVKENTTALNQYALTYTDEFKQWSVNKPKDGNNEVSYDTLNEYTQPLASQNPVSDQNEQDAEIRNGFRKPNGERPQLTWNEAFKLSKAFNTDTTGKYSDNKNYKAKPIQYEVDRVTKKTAYRVSLNRIDNGIATETPGGPTDTRVKDRITSAYFSNGMKSKRAADVVEEIANSDHGLNKLAKTLLPYVKYNNVFINLSEGKKEFIKANGEKTTAAGMYYPGSNDVTMYVNEKYNPLFVEKVLLHEVLHAITWNQLRRGNQSSRDFNALYEYAKEQIPNWENTYAMSDADEFMVALFTDSEFMKTLSNIPPMSGIKEYKNLLQEIFDYFLSLINITKSDPTLYSQAFAVATNVLEDFKQESEMNEVFNEMQDSYYDNYEPVEPGSDLFADNKSGDLMYSINEMKRLLSDKKTLSNYKMYDFKSTDEIQNEIDEESNAVEYYYNSGNTALLEESRENISDLKRIYELFDDIEIIIDRGLKLSTLSQEEKNNLELLTQSDNIELGLEILIGNLESQLDNGVASVVDEDSQYKKIDATDIENVNAFNKEAYDEYYKTNRIGTGIIESNLIFSNINEDEKGRLFSSHLDSTIELQKKKIADRYTTTREKERLEVENNFYNQMKSIINLLSLVEDKKLQYKLYELLSSPDIENFSVAQSILPGLATEGSEMKKIEPTTIPNNVNKELNNYLLDFLKNFGVESRKLDSIQNIKGSDLFGVTDALNKLIWFVEDKDISTIPEQSSTLLVMLMGYNHPAVKQLLNEIESWSRYQEMYDKYYPVYENELQVKIQAISTLLSETLIDQFKNKKPITGKDSKLINLVLKVINDFVNSLKKYFVKTNTTKENHPLLLANKIASRVLSNDIDFIGDLSIPTDYQKVNYTEGLANNKLASWIVDTFTKKFNTKLTGSLAVAGQGEDIYRNKYEQIHDLDFVVTTEDEWFDIKQYMYDINAVPYHFGWDHTDFVTEAYVIPAPGYKLQFNRLADGRINSASVQLINEETGMVQRSIKDKVMTVDFFVYKQNYNEKAVSWFTSWQDIFRGKLFLSKNKKEERLFGTTKSRLKDQKDYLLSNPVNRENRLPEFTYKHFQTSTNQEQKQAYKETLDKLSARFGIKYTIINNPNAKWVGRYKPDGTIEINEAFIDQYPDAPFHEFFHPFLDVIEKNNVKLFNALKSEIDSLLISTDPKDANLKTLLRRILNDKDYTNPDGTLNALGYKEAITELVGAHALKSHNDEWRRRVKQSNPKWEQTGWDAAVEGPGMSEARHKKVDSLMKQLWNYIRNVVAKILRPSDPSDMSGYSSGNVPLLPSELNPNMTLSDLGYLMGQGTSPVKLDIDASRDMPVQYKKFSDDNWISPSSYSGTEYSDSQRKFRDKFNEVNSILTDTDDKAIVNVTELSDRKKRELLLLKMDTIPLYKFKHAVKGRMYAENRVSMAQDLKFLKRSRKTKDEFRAEEDAPGSVLAREMGTKLHYINESILKRILELDLPADLSLIGSDWAEKTLNDVFYNDVFYKDYVAEIKKGNTPFEYEEKVLGDSIPVFDEDGNFVEEIDNAVIDKDATRSFDEMIKSMLRLYHESHKIQNEIDSTKKPIFLLEMPLYDANKDEAGTTDMMVIFSDYTASIYDHKFINFKYKKITYKEYASRPGNENKTKEELLNEIYGKREKQGFGTKRYAPSRKYPGNEFFFEIDDKNVEALYRWKQDSYDMQLGRYSQMLMDLYGVKEMRQVRVIPNAVSYTSFYDEKTQTRSVDPKRSKLQFAMIGSDEHTLLKQLPAKTELTNDDHVNAFINKLEKEKDNLREQLNKTGWKNEVLVEKFNELADTIITLKVDGGLMGVVELIKNLLGRIDSGLREEKYLDKTTGEPNPYYMKLDSINSFLKELEMYSTFVPSTKNYIEELEKKHKEDFIEFKLALGVVSEGMTMAQTKLEGAIVNRIVDINSDKKFMSEERLKSFNQQTDINSLESTFISLGNMRHPLVDMFKQMYDQIVYNRMQAEKEILSDIDIQNDKLKEWAKSKGISIYKAYEMLLNDNKDLVNKWSSALYNDVKKHVANQEVDHKWFINTMERTKKQQERFDKLRKQKEDQFEKEFGDKSFVKMNEWLDKNDIFHNGGENSAWLFAIPGIHYEPKNKEEYYDDRYKVILNNKPLKDFYDFYMEYNIELNDMVDFNISDRFVPEMHKDMIDTMMQNGLTGTKFGGNVFKTIYNNLKYHENRDMIGIDQNNRSVPVMFTDRINTEDKSIDLAKSMMVFASYVHQYKGIKELEAVALSMRLLIANSEVVKTDMYGNKIKLQGSKKFETVKKDNKNILTVMDNAINHYIYGETMSDKALGYGLDPQVVKVVKEVVSLNSRKNIAFNLISATAGHIGSMANMNRIAAEGKIFSAEDLRKARTKLNRFNFESLAVYDYFAVTNDDLTQQKADEINSNYIRNKYTRGGSYVLQRTSEELLNHTILLAMMDSYTIDPITQKAERIDFLKTKYKDHPVYGKDFKWPSIATMVKTEEKNKSEKIIKLINPFTEKEFTEKEYISFRRKVLEVAKKTRGSVPKEDIAAYKTNLFYNIIMQFKNWLPQMLREKVKGTQYDVAMGELETGSWGAMFKLLKTGHKKTYAQFMMNMIPLMGSKFELGKDNPALDKMYQEWYNNNPSDIAEMMEKYGLDSNKEEDVEKGKELIKGEFVKEHINKLKGIAKELQMYTLLMLMMLLLWWGAGDDEENKNPWIKKTIAILQRSMLEVGFFLPGLDYFTTQAVMGKGQFEMLEMLKKSPVPALGILSDGMKFITNTVAESIDVLSGLNPMGGEYITAFNIGDEGFSNPFNPEVKKDSQGPGYWLRQYLFPGSKGITDFFGMWDTTKQTDTLWEQMTSTNEKHYKT